MIQPNEIARIFIGRSRWPVKLAFYGTFQGEPFGARHMVPRKVKRVLLVHDAVHSIALFLTQKDTCNIAMHNYVPFSFPNTLSHTIAYTQLYRYPIIVTSDEAPVEQLLQNNGCPTMFRRWCTRRFKEDIPRGVYKHFFLSGITQVKGMTRFQSPDRARLNPNHSLDGMLAQTTFPIYSELPIFNMPEDEQYELAEAAGIAPSPYTIKYGAHGCMFCPFKSQSYWFDLKEKDPDLYNLCQLWRECGSTVEKQYFYYPASKVM